MTPSQATTDEVLAALPRREPGRPARRRSTGTCAPPTGIGGLDDRRGRPHRPAHGRFRRAPGRPGAADGERGRADQGRRRPARRRHRRHRHDRRPQRTLYGRRRRRVPGRPRGTVVCTAGRCRRRPPVLVRGHPDGTGLDRGPPPQRSSASSSLSRAVMLDPPASPEGALEPWPDGSTGLVTIGGDRRRPRPARGRAARRAGVRGRRPPAPPRPRAGRRQRRHPRTPAPHRARRRRGARHRRGGRSASRSASLIAFAARPLLEELPGQPRGPAATGCSRSRWLGDRRAGPADRRARGPGAGVLGGPAGRRRRR